MRGGCPFRYFPSFRDVEGITIEIWSGETSDVLACA